MLDNLVKEEKQLYDENKYWQNQDTSRVKYHL